MAKRKRTCKRYKMTRAGRRCASYGGVGSQSQRDKIFDSFRRRFSVEDLDEFVHELKAREAAAINNAGLDAQLNYMAEIGGLDWLEEILQQELREEW